MAQLVLSSSSLSSYMDCHLQYYLTHIAVLPQQKREQMQVGIETHLLVEGMLRAKMTSDTYRVPEPYGHIQTEAQRLADVYARDILPAVSPWMIEQEYQFEVEDTDGILYQSIMDLAEQDGTVRDLKTISHRPSKDSSRYRIPMVGHALGFRALTGFLEKNVVLDYLVRTKTAYYWPVELGVVTDDDIAAFTRAVNEAADGIDAGDFEPTGLESPWACATCFHQTNCGPYARMKEATHAS